MLSAEALSGIFKLNAVAYESDQAKKFNQAISFISEFGSHVYTKITYGAKASVRTYSQSK